MGELIRYEVGRFWHPSCGITVRKQDRRPRLQTSKLSGRETTRRRPCEFLQSNLKVSIPSPVPNAALSHPATAALSSIQTGAHVGSSRLRIAIRQYVFYHWSCCQLIQDGDRLTVKARTRECGQLLFAAVSRWKLSGGSTSFKWRSGYCYPES